MKPHGVLILFALILTLVHTPSKATTVNAGNDTTYCMYAGDILLSGTPAGGVYTGIGVYQSNKLYYFMPLGLLPGRYEVVYTVYIQGVPYSDTLYITLKGIPYVSAGPDLEFCVNAMPYYILEGSPAGGKWEVVKGNAQELKGDTFYISLMDTGTFELSYSLESPAGCQATDYLTIHLRKSEANAGGDLTVCKGTIVDLRALGQPSGGYWKCDQFLDGMSSEKIYTQFSNAGTYILSYYIYKNGCFAIDSMNLTIKPLPEVHACNDTTICSSNDTLYPKGYPEGGTWSGPGIYAGKLIPLQLLKTGKYTYVYSNIVNACEATDTMVLTIDDPLPDFTSSASMGAGPLTVSFHNRSKKAVSYAWDFGDPVSGSLNYSTLENPQHTFSAIGNYVVSLRVYSSIGCISDTSMVCVIHANGVGDIRLAPSGIQLYPNPATTQLFIQCAMEAGKPYEVFDYTGRVVRSGTIPEGMFSIDVEELPEAIYWIKINQQMARFVKN